MKPPFFVPTATPAAKTRKTRTFKKPPLPFETFEYGIGVNKDFLFPLSISLFLGFKEDFQIPSLGL